jgi:hypothetical protein
MDIVLSQRVGAKYFADGTYSRAVEVGERSSAANVYHQLESRLAEAVFEILAAQAVTIHVQQQLAFGTRNNCNVVGRVPAATVSYGRRFAVYSTFFRLESGRHTGMSSATARRPPSQLHRPPLGVLLGNLLGWR